MNISTLMVAFILGAKTHLLYDDEGVLIGTAILLVTSIIRRILTKGDRS